MFYKNGLTCNANIRHINLGTETDIFLNRKILGKIEIHMFYLYKSKNKPNRISYKDIMSYGKYKTRFLFLKWPYYEII